MPYETLLRLDFGDPGGDPSGLLAGWEAPSEGRRWARGRRSRVILPRPPGEDGVLLAAVVDPYVMPAVLPQQTLRVLANGRTLRLMRPSRRTVVLGRIDAATLDLAPSLEIGFEHPDIVQPNMVSSSSDSAGYSIGVLSLALLRDGPAARPATVRAAPAGPPPPVPDALDDTQLLMQFASIGDNCEFGMAQRAAGAEPSDLLRFAGSEPAGLLRAFEEDFACIADPGYLDFDIHANGTLREYILHLRRYTLDMHTRVLEGSMPVERLIGREIKKLSLLHRLLLEDLATARRIFVYKRNDGADPGFVAALHRALQRHGRNALLVVSLSDAAHPPGTVEPVGDDLYRGYIDRLSRYDNAASPPSPVWLDLCRRCYALWHARRHGAQVAAA
ncbi:hypothetical protein [Acidisphaera rubrifaciens]|uniref:Uncharacterized protein n=1 Tax=Acidisphaera rubrifaciens HS-AP3 TaxID=1231350 RepID=A0A0D6P911_9PROT|nr:hypothetical protein [Acidisphaera rubrifaciens]GAN77354.1 hypothetical protein Asru_0289_04 [Acidisphaera rubrifaciens HS-AP3]